MSNELNMNGISDMRSIRLTLKRIAYIDKVRPMEKVPTLPMKAFPL
jgi:hypothetical protein